jgi:hypothetical protein
MALLSEDQYYYYYDVRGITRVFDLDVAGWAMIPWIETSHGVTPHGSAALTS